MTHNPKILIGTPIHICKDYSMERWLENVSELRGQTPVDLLLVDNSPGTDYIEKVKGYCVKYGIKDYKIEHIEIDQNLGSDIRIEVSQETIRKAVLLNNYDAWFSWECDQIIPADSLDKLVEIMRERNDLVMIVNNCWDRKNPAGFNNDMGCTLIKKECLEKNWFLPERNGKISLNLADRFPTLFKERVFQNGGSYFDAFGIIDPVYHLDNS